MKVYRCARNSCIALSLGLFVATTPGCFTAFEIGEIVDGVKRFKRDKSYEQQRARDAVLERTNYQVFNTLPPQNFYHLNLTNSIYNPRREMTNVP